MGLEIPIIKRILSFIVDVEVFNSISTMIVSYFDYDFHAFFSNELLIGSLSELEMLSNNWLIQFV